MTRLKVHHYAEVGRPLLEIAADLDISLRSVERIVSEDPPSREEIAADMRLTGRGPGRPSRVAQYEEPVRNLLLEFPDLPGTEVLRRSRAWGYRGSRSPMLALVTRVRPPPPKEPVIRFEGLPGEFAQFDFGQAKVPFADGKRHTVRFFAGRLKYSRFVHVVLVADEQAETLIRSILACLVAFGGSPKQWVFDNPKTIRISRIGEPLVLHPYLRDLVAEMNVLPEMCAPRSGNQKGSVESLVKFTKRGFLFVREFRDLEDVQEQLTAWLHEVNFVRRCDATQAIPGSVRDADERKWLEQRPVRWTPENYAIRESRTITPMALVGYRGTPYSTLPDLIGATATLLVRANEIEMRVGNAGWVHVRKDHQRQVQRLPEHCRAVLAVVHGRRKHNYFKRECLLELGAAAHDFLEQLIHRRSGGSWAPDVDLLFDLLVRHGDHDLRTALRACHLREEWSGRAVAREIRSAA